MYGAQFSERHIGSHMIAHILIMLITEDELKAQFISLFNNLKGRDYAGEYHEIPNYQEVSVEAEDRFIE